MAEKTFIVDGTVVHANSRGGGGMHGGAVVYTVDENGGYEYKVIVTTDGTNYTKWKIDDDRTRHPTYDSFSEAMEAAGRMVAGRARHRQRQINDMRAANAEIEAFFNNGK